MALARWTGARPDPAVAGSPRGHRCRQQDRADPDPARADRALLPRPLTSSIAPERGADPRPVVAGFAPDGASLPLEATVSLQRGDKMRMLSASSAGKPISDLRSEDRSRRASMVPPIRQLQAISLRWRPPGAAGFCCGSPASLSLGGPRSLSP